MPQTDCWGHGAAKLLNDSTNSGRGAAWYNRRMNKKPTALSLVLCGVLITDVIVADDKKHIEQREPRDTVAHHFRQNQMGVTWKPAMRPIMWKTNNGVRGDAFMHEVTYSINQKIQINHRVNRGTDGHLCKCWQVRRISGHLCGEWSGKFATAEEAYQLAA